MKKKIVSYFLMAACVSTLILPVQAEAKSRPVKPAKVSTLSVKNTSTAGKIKVSFKKVNRVSGYRIAVSEHKNFKGRKLYLVKGTKKVLSVKKGKQYFVKVQAYKKYKKNTVYGTWSSTKSVFTTPANTVLKKQSAAATSVKLTAKKASGITGYQFSISEKEDFSKKKMASSKSENYTFSGLKANKKYFVKVRTYKKYKKKTLYGTWSSHKAVITTPANTECQKWSTTSNSIKLTAKKASGVTGYQFSISESKNASPKKITASKSGNYTFSGLKANKKYFVRVRAYKKYKKNTLYGKWSGQKEISTKKAVTNDTSKDNSAVTEKAKYTYEIQTLSKYTDLYTQVYYPFFIKTDNPDPTTIFFDGILGAYNDIYQDIHYTGNDDWWFQSVPGGYVVNPSFQNAGKHTLTIYEMNKGKKIKAYSCQITVTDQHEGRDAAFQKIFDEVYDPTLTATDNLNNLQNYFTSHFVQLISNSKHPAIPLAQNQGAWFQTHNASCWNATDYMIWCANKMGLEAKSEDPGTPGEGSLHQAAYIKIDGEWQWYDANAPVMYYDEYYTTWDYIL